MCLGELAQVLDVGPDRSAVVRMSGRTLTVSLLTLEEPVAPGDWLVCHSGFALSRLTPEEADDAAAIRGTATKTTTQQGTNPTPLKGES